jgi:hypothetical protein
MKLSARFRYWLYFVSLLVFSSGIAWKLLDAFVLVSGPFGQAKHPAQPWMLRAHGAGALAWVFLFGMLAAHHIPKGWRSGRKRSTGSAMIGLGVALILSGYLLYYAAGEELRASTSFLHFWVGALSPLLFFLHLLRRP